MIVTAKHLEGFRFEVSSGRHSLITDQPPEYGGTDRGPMASEIFLFAVASCFGQSMLHVAKKMRKTATQLVVEVTAGKNASKFCFSEIVITVKADCAPDILEKIMALAQKYCFVTNSLSGSVKITHRSKST
ncbi:MAG: OsmC family protein [Desulfovibrio sp.]|jgi:putative redox protein|nr:OsmC family protein [Desulfovibrio sp.]